MRRTLPSGCYLDAATSFLTKPPHVLLGRYIRAACVELTFFQAATIQGHNIRMPNGLQMCADPTTEVAAAGCCPPTHDKDDSGRADCKYVNEVMSYDKAVQRCAARTDGYTELCPDRWSVPGCYTVSTGSWQGTVAEDERSWLNMEHVTSCAIKVQVLTNGRGACCAHPTEAVWARYQSEHCLTACARLSIRNSCAQ